MKGVEAQVIPIAVEKERARKLEKMKHRLEDPYFRECINRVKRSVQMGYTLNEAKQSNGIEGEAFWEDLKFALSVSIMSPENIVLEWQLRNQNRYHQALLLFQEASRKEEQDAIDKNGNAFKKIVKTPDPEMMLKALMMLQKIDESDVEMKRAFGLIRPVQFNDEPQNEINVTKAEISEARERFDAELRAGIFNKLDAQRRAQAPKPLDVLAGSEVERGADTVGQVTLDVYPSSRQEQGNSIPEVVSDGRLDVLHNMVSVVVQNETGS